jgi:60 kDa SS-A/Ro ribonucleoprotein
LAKYLGGQKVVKSRDALQITRPEPADINQAELWRQLVKGELATPDTWEVELSKGGDKKASWLRLFAENKLGGLAILRNVRNMTKAGVKEAKAMDCRTDWQSVPR